MKAKALSLLAEIERGLPDERTVLLAAASAPLSFLAIHGCSAWTYIAELRRARTALAAARKRIETELP